MSEPIDHQSPGAEGGPEELRRDFERRIPAPAAGATGTLPIALGEVAVLARAAPDEEEAD